MTDIVERLRLKDGMEFPDPDLFRDAADEIERLRTALIDITDHFASVMRGPFFRGVTFENGVEGIPTIARARAAIPKAKDG